MRKRLIHAFQCIIYSTVRAYAKIEMTSQELYYCKGFDMMHRHVMFPGTCIVKVRMYRQYSIVYWFLIGKPRLVKKLKTASPGPRVSVWEFLD